MTTLDAFRAKLNLRVASAGNASRWKSDALEAYMAALRLRREEFDNASRSLLASVIKPRLDAVAKLFTGARTITDEPASRACCWFAYSDRFPVTAKIEFAVEHDQSIEHVFVRCDCSLMPVFVRFQPHDKLASPLDELSPDRIGDWIEERILEFLDVYLGHDRGQDDLEEDLVTDPVCGMRLRRSETVGQADYRGHPYFFCRTECREKFKTSPEAFVTVRTM